MTESSKTRISARQVLSDIRSGMDHSALKAKYGLSDRALSSLYAKLSEKGYTDPSANFSTAFPSRGPTERTSSPEATVSWQCPACNLGQEGQPDECPRCGLLTAKANQLPREQTANGSSREPDGKKNARMGSSRWFAVILSVIILAIGATLLMGVSMRGSHEPTPLMGRVERDAGPVIQITEANFQQRLVEASNTQPILLEFYRDT